MSRRKNTWYLENHNRKGGVFSHIYEVVERCGLYCSTTRLIGNKRRMAIGGWATMDKPHVFVEVHEYTTELAIMKDCRDYYYMVRDKYPSLLDELMNKKREERIS